MKEIELEKLMQAGRDAIDKIVEESRSKITIVALGEIGIGNTTSASALFAALCNIDAEEICGYGAGLDEGGRRRKVEIVKRALKTHENVVKNGNPKEIASALGGAEIVAMAGAALQAHEKGIGVVVGGFIATAGALLAARIHPIVTENYFLASKSAEKGHLLALNAIREIARKNGIPELAPPALDMGLRMGEATACTLVVPLLRSAASLPNMAKLSDVIGK